MPPACCSERNQRKGEKLLHEITKPDRPFYFPSLDPADIVCDMCDGGINISMPSGDG